MIRKGVEISELKFPCVLRIKPILSACPLFLVSASFLPLSALLVTFPAVSLPLFPNLDIPMAGSLLRHSEVTLLDKFP